MWRCMVARVPGATRFLAKSDQASSLKCLTSTSARGTRTCRNVVVRDYVSICLKGTRNQAQKYSGRKKLWGSGLTYENERSPLKRMGIALPQFQHGGPESSRFRVPFAKVPVKGVHVLGRALVVH